MRAVHVGTLSRCEAGRAPSTGGLSAVQALLSSGLSASAVSAGFGALNGHEMMSAMLTTVCAGVLQAKSQLGWEPQVALRDGLRRMVKDFSERLHVPLPPDSKPVDELAGT